MNNSNLFKLIDGEFSPTEAREILLSLIDYKIQFHNLKVFETKEKLGVAHPKSLERIEQLKETKARLLDLLKEVGSNDMQLIIESTITVESKKLAEAAK